MKIKRVLTLSASVLLLVLFMYLTALFYLTRQRVLSPVSPSPLNERQTKELNEQLDRLYPDRKALLKNSPYKAGAGELHIGAGSAILIDSFTGDVLYEKNADELIPPASMTKLVEMYVVLDKVQKGEISLDDEVPLPPQCWASNLPKDASLMFLDEGQHVTLRELLSGLAVASGNDASIATALYVSRSMNSFVSEMNSLIEGMGLKQTHFVESSGYSEKNITTAREFAAFSRVYLNKFPFTLEDYHSQKVLKYPLEKNLPDFQKELKDSQAVVQYNTNKLLGKLEGCDGLKTGFIYESGYNLALTAKRGNMRLISVTMKGPGTKTSEGNHYRIQDGTELMEYGFASFTDYKEEQDFEYQVSVLGSTLTSVNLVPAQKLEFTFPKSAEEDLQVSVKVPDCLFGQINTGASFGKIEYTSKGILIATVNLVADRHSSQAGFFKRTFDSLVMKSLH